MGTRDPCAPNACQRTVNLTYGVEREMYAWVGDALVAAVTDAQGDRLSSERRHALVSGWTTMAAIIFDEP